MPDLDPNVQKHLIKQIASDAVAAATAVRDYLPDADTCELTFVGPGGPLAETALLVGTSPSESLAIRTDAAGKWLAPIGSPEFKVDAIGLSEATVAAITDGTPRTISLSAPS